MKVLITGGAGFIGSHLTQKHINLGDEVYVIDNLITGQKDNILDFLAHETFHYYEEDIVTFDFRKLPKLDLIYHLASPASPIQYKKYPVETLRVNAEGTYRVLEFMKRTQSDAFVITSTSEVYGDPEVHPQTEEYWGNVNPNGIRSCYDEAKRYSEAMVMTYYRTYGLNVRIARLFNTYGPNMEQNDGRVVSNFIMQSLKQEPITIYGDGMQTRSFCYVSDTAEGLYRLVKTPSIAGQVVNLGNPDERTINDLALLVKDMTHSS
jgi:nucleoside-diphosphate-sugar epimerase